MPKPHNFKQSHCNIEGCPNPHAGAGLCKAHYYQANKAKYRDRARENARKQREIERLIVSNPPANAMRCSVEDCERVDLVGLLCNKHYQVKGIRANEAMVVDYEDFWKFVKTQILLSQDGTRVMGLRRRN